MFRESNTPYFIQPSSSHYVHLHLSIVKGFYIFNLLTQHVHQVSSVGAGFVAIIRLSGKESNLTQPMNTTQHSIRNTTHYSFYRHLRRDAFTTSDTLSCRLSEAGYAISPHSLNLFSLSSYIISNLV